MISATSFIILSPRTTIPNNNNNQQFVKRCQYYRAKITHRIDNVIVAVFFIDWGNTK